MPEVKPTVFVIDGDAAVSNLVCGIAAPLGFEVLTFPDTRAALVEAARAMPGLVLVNVGAMTNGVLPALDEIRRRAPECDLVLMADDGVDAVLDVLAAGATACLTRPLVPARLEALLRIARDEIERRAAVSELEAELARRARFHGMVGRSAVMLELFSLVRRVAPHASGALIVGETGTGKALVARALHALGPRSDRPLVTVDCSAIIETLFEGELFGHARDGSNGTGERPPGTFARANGGTIFLDEVGALPLGMQGKLLRVLERGEMTRSGSEEKAVLDVHVIAATTRALDREVEQGRFHADLLSRLSATSLDVPPLRERREDVPLLIRAFLEEFGARAGRVFRGASVRAERMAARYDWPGNVGELRTVIERASERAAGPVIDDLDVTPAAPSARVPASSGPAPIRAIADLERDEITRALEETKGNKNQAARRLGISRRALYRRLEKFGLGASAAPPER